MNNILCCNEKALLLYPNIICRAYSLHQSISLKFNEQKLFVGFIEVEIECLQKKNGEKKKYHNKFVNSVGKQFSLVFAIPIDAD